MEIKTYTRADQERDLERHFTGCRKYWERTLGVSSDESKEPVLRALNELPRYNPFFPYERVTFDEDLLCSFKKCRLMDAYGMEWERHWNEHSSFIRKEGLPCQTT